MPPTNKSARSAPSTLITPSIVLLLGAIIGLIYVFGIPPWQHYDEPTHFEYAWLIANKPQLIESRGYDQALRREIAASMIEHDFFEKNLGSPPNLLSQTTPIWIGISQIDDRPLYHWLAAIPLRVLTYTDVDIQLYAARLASLLLFLITLGAAFGIAAEITPAKSFLRWALPLNMVLLPGLMELMTAVNNDVGATCFFSLFIWAGVRIIKRDLSLPRLAALILTALACYFTKLTVSITLVMFVIPLIFSVLGPTRQRIAWSIFLSLALAGILSLFSWGDAAHWARDNSFQLANTRLKMVDAPVGTYAIQVTKAPGEPNHRIYQFLPYQQAQALKGQEVTLGAWIWSDKPMSIRSPSVSNGDKESYKELEISTQKRFYAFSTHIPNDTTRLFVTLSSLSVEPDTSGTIFFDGVTLAEGRYDTTRPPKLNNEDASSGEWGGKPFTNLLPNPSAEQGGPRFRPWAERLIAKNYPGGPSLMLASALDWKQADWYFISVLRLLFQSFWGKFGWGQVRLLGRYMYWILLAMTLIGLFGTSTRFFRRPRSYPIPILFFLVVSMASVWGPAIMRGINSLHGQIFIPSARYAYPAIIPTMLLLTAGWQEITKQIRNRLKLPSFLAIAFWATFWIGLNILAFYTLFNYYYK